MFLFDANFLIALGDADHVHHDEAQTFFTLKKQDGWATCPLTENAFLRILGHPNYPKGPSSPCAARALLQEFICQSGHQFWDDTISLVDSRKFPTLPGSKNLTDYYLLALAIKNRGKLITFDQRIDPGLLEGGISSYHVIKPPNPAIELKLLP